MILVIPLINAKRIPNLSKFIDEPEQTLIERAEMIRDNFEFQEKISIILGENVKNWPPQEIVEQRIYDGFPSDADKLWMERFEIAPWADKASLVEGFEDARYRELAARIICYQKPEFASSKMLDSYNDFVKTRLYSKGPWLKDRGQTIDQAITEAESSLADSEDDEMNQVLESLLDHYRQKKA